MADSQIDGNALKAMLGAGVNCVSEHVALINDLNVFPVPDGDTGINLHHTLQRAWQEIANREEDALCVVAERFAYGALMGARGNSGTIMSQFLRGFAAGLKQASVLTAPLLIDACESAVARAYAAVSQPVEGTILTVARESVADLTVDMSLDEIFASMVNAAHRSVNNTPNLLPLLKEAGVVDAGGMGLLCFLQGLKKHVCGERAEIRLPAPGEFERPTLQAAPAESYGYDVQFMMMGERLDVGAVREDMEQLGWSVIVAGDSTAIKVHIHIDNPALPLDYAVRAGADLTDV
ncbi:MAG: DAK2 domain-containing protein, partial [Chloroflexi bacterium]|nr:DAK2 domain-containing protein [Chloroflexota bacterium]